MARHKRENFRREIHTGLYGQAAEGVLNNVIEYCRKYGSSLDSRSFKLVEVERSVDNEIMLSVFDDRYDVSMFKTVFRNGFKNDVQVRTWLAGCVKGVAKLAILNRRDGDLHKAEIAKVDGWTRANMANLYLESFRDGDIPAAAYYAVYETLKGRKTAKAKFPDGVFASAVGEPFDPVRAELETYRREAEEKIYADLAAELHRLENEHQAEREKLRAKFTDLKDAARANAKAAERALNNEIAAALNAAA